MFNLVWQTARLVVIDKEHCPWQEH